MFCVKCGTKMDMDAAFCPQCGNQVAVAGSAASTAGLGNSKQTQPSRDTSTSPSPSASFRTTVTDSAVAAPSGAVIKAVAALVVFAFFIGWRLGWFDSLPIFDRSPTIHASTDAELDAEMLKAEMNQPPAKVAEFEAAMMTVVTICTAASAGDAKDLCIRRLNGKTWNQVIRVAKKIDDSDTSMTEKKRLASQF